MKEKSRAPKWALYNLVIIVFVVLGTVFEIQKAWNIFLFLYIGQMAAYLMLKLTFDQAEKADIKSWTYQYRNSRDEFRAKGLLVPYWLMLTTTVVPILILAAYGHILLVPIGIVYWATYHDVHGFEYHKAGKENQETINQWCDETFGTVVTAHRSATRAAEEMDELIAELCKDDRNPKAPEEAADVTINLFRLAGVMGFDLLEEVNKKMKINRGREWNLTGDGCGYHKK